MIITNYTTLIIKKKTIIIYTMHYVFYSLYFYLKEKNLTYTLKLFMHLNNTVDI
jgi:hypothetical protein